MQPQNPEEAIKLIYTIDPEVKIIYSPWTDLFYVTANVEIGKDGFLSGIVEHRATIDEAVWAYWDRIVGLAGSEKLIVKAMRDDRVEYRWNGSVFAKLS